MSFRPTREEIEQDRKKRDLVAARAPFAQQVEFKHWLWSRGYGLTFYDLEKSFAAYIPIEVDSSHLYFCPIKKYGIVATTPHYENGDFIMNETSATGVLVFNPDGFKVIKDGLYWMAVQITIVPLMITVKCLHEVRPILHVPNYKDLDKHGILSSAVSILEFA